jgi:hypothetical protein
MDRREFLETSTMLAGGALLGGVPAPPVPSERQRVEGLMLGIQVGAVSFVDERTLRVLDGLKEMAAINTLFVATFTYGRGIAGRQVPNQPLPDHGKQEYDTSTFRGGNYATPHPQYYRDTAIRPEHAPDHGAYDVLADVIPQARQRNMKVIAWFEDVIAADVPGFDRAREVVLSGPPSTFACSRNPHTRNFWLGLVEDYLRSRLKNDQVEDDTFSVESPEGNFPGHNIVAKFPGKKDGIIVIASHYDTNYPLRKTSFIGANDGAATSALLLELAQHLRGSKLEGYSVWLLWTDAEEAVRTWTATDSLYGTRHLAEVWEKDGTLKKIKAFLLADMIGDADLDIQRDSNSTPWLEDLALEAATRLGYQSHFFAQSTSVNDDHIPFAERGVPVADIIDIDYGYNNVFHHTTQDTIDKLSSRSLEISGDVIWETVQLVNERK